MEKSVWPLGLSCERTTLAFWAEPINALTTLLTFVVCWICWREWKRAGANDLSALLYIALMTVIGVTSFIMHTAPTKTISLIDTLATAGFIILALFGLFQRHLEMRVLSSLLCAGAFLATAPFIADYAKAVVSRDTALFVPVLFIFPIAGSLMIFHAEKINPARRDGQVACARLVMLGSVIFMFGLAARAVDLPFCSRIPTGVHFIWHIALSATCGLVTVAYIRNKPLRP